jgi:hypothetical protein
MLWICQTGTSPPFTHSVWVEITDGPPDMLTKMIGLALLLMAAGVQQGHAMEALAEFRWKQRIVLVYGTEDDPRLQRQIAELTQKPEAMSDRDLLVLKVAGPTVEALHGGASAGAAILPIGSAERLRQEGKIDGRSFQVLLIGKDGGVKLRRSDVVDPEEIIALIDSMPMRQTEQQARD